MLSALIFLGAQFVGGIIVTLLSVDLEQLVKNPDASENIQVKMSAETLALTTVITGIIAVVLVKWLLKSIHMKEAFTPRNIQSGSHLAWGLLAIIGAFAGIFSTNLLSEQLKLPNMLENEFLDMSQSLIGILSIGVIAPIVEELIFRESIEGQMLRDGASPQKAICLSALAFGIIHINPAQVPFAIIIGVVLGILYWKTRNILLCGLVHIANNMVAVIEMHVMGREAMEGSFADLMGSDAYVWGVMAASLLISAGLLWGFCKKTQYNIENTTKEI